MAYYFVLTELTRVRLELGLFDIFRKIIQNSPRSVYKWRILTPNVPKLLICVILPLYMIFIIDFSLLIQKYSKKIQNNIQF